MQRINATVMTLANYYALRDVKANIRSTSGSSALRKIEMSELKRLARAWLENHPELIEVAADTGQKVPEFRKIAEREERERRRKKDKLRP
jgi:hypothetical protein